MINGARFGRSHASNPDGSSYFNYLEYVKQLALEVGFEVDTDILRIPSTRRICMVKGCTDRACRTLVDVAEPKVGARRSYEAGSAEDVSWACLTMAGLAVLYRILSVASRSQQTTRLHCSREFVRATQRVGLLVTLMEGD